MEMVVMKRGSEKGEWLSVMCVGSKTVVRLPKYASASQLDFVLVPDIVQVNPICLFTISVEYGGF